MKSNSAIAREILEAVETLAAGDFYCYRHELDGAIKTALDARDAEHAKFCKQCGSKAASFYELGAWWCQDHHPSFDLKSWVERKFADLGVATREEIGTHCALLLSDLGVLQAPASQAVPSDVIEVLKFYADISTELKARAYESDMGDRARECLRRLGVGT